MPHLYNAFRACNCSCTSTPLSPYMSEEVATFSSSLYMYGACPDASVYFIPWNIIIPCEGFLFAIVIYLQQRVGGRFFGYISVIWNHDWPPDLISIVLNDGEPISGGAIAP
ncbi:hypothetical protein Cni_G05940 [Canna indica]|uniref:Uncharacterized protein n=1 Tax=Canna indica TaxID=4628 RepID=A0AAQ3JY70_9LILI|nr:hypothetical protein Cni_G05940 [Canna indica]